MLKHSAYEFRVTVRERGISALKLAAFHVSRSHSSRFSRPPSKNNFYLSVIS